MSSAIVVCRSMMLCWKYKLWGVCWLENVKSAEVQHEKSQKVGLGWQYSTREPSKVLMLSVLDK